MRIPEGMCRLTQRGYATHAAVSLWDGILFVAGRVPRAGTYLRVCPPLVRHAGQRKCFRLLSSYLRDTTLEWEARYRGLLKNYRRQGIAAIQGFEKD